MLTDNAENERVDALLGVPVARVHIDVADRADLAELRVRWAGLTAVPVVVEHREDAVDASWAGLDVRTLVIGEHSAGRFAAHSVVIPPGGTLPQHVVRDTHTVLLVTDGDVELEIGASVQQVGQHSLGYAPPETSQGIRNASGTPATVLVVHSPAGSDRAFAAAHAQWRSSGETDVAQYARVLEPYGFRFTDDEQPRDRRTNEARPPVDFDIAAVGDMERLRQLFASREPLPQLVATSAAEFDTAAAGGTTCRKQLLNGDQSAGTAMVNMLAGVPGMNAPAHHQPTEDEFFFVTGGTLTLTCGSQTRRLTAGALGYAPRNCTHGFVNETDQDARFVTLNSPAGHERSLAHLRRLASEHASPQDILSAAVAGGWVIHDPEALVGTPRG